MMFDSTQSSAWAKPTLSLTLIATALIALAASQLLHAESGRYRGASGADWTLGDNWDDGAGVQLASGSYPGSTASNIATFGLDPSAPAAVSDGEVLLPSNVGASAPVELIIENDAGAVVIDLNGNTLTVSELTVASGASLSVRDSSVSGAGRLIVQDPFTPGAASGNISVDANAILEFAGGFGPTGPATLSIAVDGIVEVKSDLLRMSDTTFNNAGLLRVQPTEAELVIVSGGQIVGALECITNNSPVRTISVDALENISTLSASGGGTMTITGALTTTGDVTLTSVILNVGSTGANIGGDLAISSTQASTGRIICAGDISVSGATTISGAMSGVNETSLGVSNTSAQLAVSVSANQPTNMAAGEPTGTSTLATAALIVLTPSGSNLDINAFTFNIDTTNLTAGGIQTGTVGDLVLFRDANANGQFDSGELLAERDGSSIPGGVRFVLGTPATLTAGTAETWGLAFLSTQTATGSIGVSLTAGAVEAAGSPILTGLPIATQSIAVARPAVVSVTSVAAVNDLANAIPIANQNLNTLALNLANSGAGTARVDGITLDLSAIWDDNVNYDPNTAITRVSTYVDGNALGESTTANGRFEADNNLDERLDRQTVSDLLTVGVGNGGRLVREAQLQLLFSTPLEIDPNDSKIIYFVIEIVSSTSIFNTGLTRNLDMTLSLAAGTPPLITLSAPADVVQSLGDDISGRTLTFRAQPKKVDSGCALNAGNDNVAILLWLLAISALVIALRREKCEA